MERQIEETKPNKMVRNLEIFKDNLMENTLVFLYTQYQCTNKNVSETHFKLRFFH